MRSQKFGQGIFLPDYEAYNRVALQELFEKLSGELDKAEKSGLKDVHLRFSSTLEPYEDCTTGPVEVQISGERELTDFEKVQALEQKRIEALAKKLNVTFYEASIVDRLEKANKVKL